MMPHAMSFPGGHVAIAFVGVGGTEAVGPRRFPHRLFNGGAARQLQVARIERQQGLIDVVGPEFRARRFHQPRYAVIMIGVSVGDYDPLHIGRFQTEQSHAGLQQVERESGARVDQGEPLVLKDVRPSGSRMRMAFLGNGHGVDSSPVLVGETQHHSVAGRITVA